MFEERQQMWANPWGWLALVLLAVTGGFAMAQSSWVGAIGPGVGLLVVLAIQLRVTVDSAVRIRFAVFGKTIEFHHIKEAAIIEYKWTQFGGWGIRFGAGAIAYSIWGKQAVRLFMDGRDVVIQTRQPEELLDALRLAGVSITTD